MLDQSLHVPLLALQVLNQLLPVLGNPGDILPRTGTRNDAKAIQDLDRIGARLSQETVIRCKKKVLSACYLTEIVKIVSCKTII